MRALRNHLLSQIKRCAQLYQMFVSGNNFFLINSNISGSTCVSLLTYGRKIFIANVGDSRAIIARCLVGSDQVSADALTNDHKPDDPNEAKVILANNGRIDSYRD
jgi:serine/threonine protein phosphatase PrpC